MTSLLSTSTFVESPFVIVKIGKYTFGSYTDKGNLNKYGSSLSVTYPNYMQSIDITKINGVETNNFAFNSSNKNEDCVIEFYFK